MKKTEILILGCSPRKDGNSDFAARHAAKTVREMGFEHELLFLRDYHILPCRGCRYCSASPGFKCILDEKDQCSFLLERISMARTICFCSPIFFYHLPAHFKALIDRGQSRYEKWSKTGHQEMPGKALCILIAGRKKGEELFRGSLLSLKYFLLPFNRKIFDLCLRGLDETGDLENDLQSLAGISDYIIRELINAYDA